MTLELKYAVWTLILALVQIALTAIFRTMETGLPYNTGPRDVPSRAPVGKITGRLYRAQNNLLETLPVFLGAVLIAQFAPFHSMKILHGAMLYFWARVVYVPLYAFGIPYARTVAWAASVVGILMIIAALF